MHKKRIKLLFFILYNIQIYVVRNIIFAWNIHIYRSCLSYYFMIIFIIYNYAKTIKSFFKIVCLYNFHEKGYKTKRADNICPYAAYNQFNRCGYIGFLSSIQQNKFQKNNSITMSVWTQQYCWHILVCYSSTKFIAFLLNSRTFIPVNKSLCHFV